MPPLCRAVVLLCVVGCRGGDDSGGDGARADAARPADAAASPDARGLDAGDPDGAPAVVCVSLDFAPGSIIFTLSEDSLQDIPLAVTPDLATVLVQRAEGGCAADFAVLVADAMSTDHDDYALLDATAALVGAGLDVDSERTLTMLFNGLTVIGVTVDGLGFDSATRSAAGLVDFQPGSSEPFAALAATAGQQLLDPVLSSDGLAFYYTLVDDDAGVAGVYQSVRASAADPFPAASRMPAAVQDAGVVTGISSDRLVLFLESGFAMSALTRESTDDPFDTPVSGLPGFRVRPSGDCAVLIGSCTAAGCPGEDICSYSR